MDSAARKQPDVARLRADLSAASVEMLSAQCAADRVRLQYSPQDIITYGDPTTLRRAVSAAEFLYRFFSQIGARIQNDEDGNHGNG
jgi:hypothetical protein